MKSMRICAAIVLSFIGSMSVFAQGVELNPAYISGRVSLSNAVWADKVGSAYVYARADGGFYSSAPVQADGGYTLTVNAPADGSSRTYAVYATLYLKNDLGAIIQIGTDRNSVTIVKDATVSSDLSAALAKLHVKITPTNTAGDYASLLIYNQSGYPDLYFNWSFRNTENDWSIEGTVDFPANVKTQWIWAQAYPKDAATFTGANIATQDFVASPDETVNLELACTFPYAPKKGRVKGAIELDNIPSGLEFQSHHFFYPHTDVTSNPGTFDAETTSLGPQWMWLYTWFTNGTYVYWPYSTIVPALTNGLPYITVHEGQTTDWNPRGRIAGTINGTLRITGTMSLADTQSSSRQIYAYGISGSPSNGGNVSCRDLPVTGEFSVPVFPGTWRFSLNGYLYFIKSSDDPENYINSGTSVSDNRPANTYTVFDGQSLSGVDYEIPTGSVKIKFSVTDGSLVSSPSLNFDYSQKDAAGNTVMSGTGYAYGPNHPLVENQATLVGPPGVYLVYASAQVNGSTVTFDPKQVIVIEGVEQVLEINGPSLSVISPNAGIYTYDDQTTVAGTADDNVMVASVMVNGTKVATTSTGNPEKPREVSFSVPYTLVNGPNKIVVVATDSVGKIAQDTRYVYRDRAAPTLSFMPATSTTPYGLITVEGKASDDNAVQRVYVNGLEVPFISTMNSDDPHEVSFSSGVSLNEGPNSISVTVVDICKRTTAETHIVTKGELDSTPPQFPVLNDVILEQASPQGTAYTLSVPAVTDDSDPSPKVSSNAPAVFPPGDTTVTWTAEDSSHNKATAFQEVIVRDTTAPSITAPEDFILEYSGENAAEEHIGTPTVNDNADDHPVVTVSLPPVFPLGVTTLTWTAADSSGNEATAVQKITVVDTTSPAFGKPADVELEQLEPEGTRFTLPIPAATDLCDAAPIVMSDAPAVFPAGTTVVMWTAKDASGNAAYAVQKVIVRDTTPPEVNAPGPVTAEQSSYQGAIVPIGEATSADAVDLNPTITNNAPAIFPTGQTTVIWTATDAVGNASRATQLVTVIDTTPPVIGALEPVIIVQNRIEGVVATLKQPVISDLGDPAPKITNDAPAIFPRGVTNVTWKAVDKSNNAATALQTVTVVDLTPPTVIAPPDVIAEQGSPQGAVVSLGTPEVTDPFDTQFALSNDAPGVFPPGTTTVTWEAVDMSGNAGTATQKVTVHDTTPPIFGTLDDVLLDQTGANGTDHVLPKPVVTDLVDPSPTVTSNAPASFPAGTTIVTWTATDKSGNTSTAAQRVIVKDTKGPMLTLTAWPRILVAHGLRHDKDDDKDYDKDCREDGNGMVPILVFYRAKNAIDGDRTRYVELVSASSDEPVDRNQKDIHVISSHMILVRCEADPVKDGRVYTLNYQVSDKSGNVTTASVRVEVRLRPKVPAVDSGAAYAVTPERRLWDLGDRDYRRVFLH